MRGRYSLPADPGHLHSVVARQQRRSRTGSHRSPVHKRGINPGVIAASAVGARLAATSSEGMILKRRIACVGCGDGEDDCECKKLKRVRAAALIALLNTVSVSLELLKRQS